MKALLLGVILLLGLVLFHVREGYYSDTNITSALSSLKTVPPTLSGLQTTLQGFDAMTLDVADALRSLNSILGSSDMSLDTKGVIMNVRSIKTEMNTLQDNLMATTTSLKQIKDVKVTIRVGQEAKTVTLAEAIPHLQTQVADLSDKLRKIPDT
jgi:translation initiation factor 1 (eIF-1/SUI1)